jgi:surfeit locus 1 family protein
MSIVLRRLTQGPRLFLTLFVVLGALIMIRLGFWQLQRRTERLQRNATYISRTSEPPLRIDGPLDDPATAEYRQALVEGDFDYDHEIIPVGPTRGGEPGVHLLTPLRLSGEQAVLVDRGWIPYEEREPADRAAYHGSEHASVRGRILLGGTRSSLLMSAPAASQPGGPAVDAWSSVDLPRIQNQLPYTLLPFYVEQLPEEGDPELPWRGDEIVLDEGPHLSYAIQWFAFTVILLVGYTAVMLRSDQSSTKQQPESP